MAGTYSYSSYQNGSDKDFNKISQNVGSNIQKILQNVVSMRKMVTMIGATHDSHELRQKLLQIQHYTNTLAKDTSSSLKELMTIPMPPSPSQQKECKMQRERLAEDFSTALNAFQEIQRKACQKEKEEMQRVRANSALLPPPPSKRGGGGGGFEDEQLFELQDSSPRYTQAQMLEEEKNLQLIEEQEQAIKRLEVDINAVNQLFKDLGSIVHDQGEVIDSIEANVEKADVYVSEGNTQLRQALGYKNKMIKRKLALLLFALIVVALLIIFFTWR